MEQQFRISIPGTEVNVDDINLVSANAAKAMDRTLSELLRMGGVDRGIIPQGHYGVSDIRRGLLQPTGYPDASLSASPFRAILGSSLLGGTAIGIRSAFSPGSIFQFAAVATAQPRWDLVYARVDVDVPDSPAVRYVKANDDSVSALSVSKTISTRVTLGVVQGAEGATPARPSAPSDSGSSFYIPLAYVLLPATHTLTTEIGPTQIAEAFRSLPLAPATGVPNLRPASINSDPIRLGNEPWVASGHRPRGYVPASVVGAECRFWR